MKRYFNIMFLFFVCFACFLSSDRFSFVKDRILQVSSDKLENKPITIVIDPGHGGRDPGKVGVNNALEKDVNLSIALKLKNLLEQNDIKVIMTREEDMGLYSESDSNKKRADLKARVGIINDSGADLAVSIHQNSFTEEYVKGAQVFFHSKSEQGKRLAEIMQAQIIKTIADDNHRKAKSNSNYYMLTKTDCPLVIVECGYMSNIRESALLVDEDYQEKMAYAIHLAIMRYINRGEFKKELLRAMAQPLSNDYFLAGIFPRKEIM
ncbi:MAG: putative rane protein [Herbinix sp.]|nr:putative rane protein [Herbinix sp.]